MKKRDRPKEPSCPTCRHPEYKIGKAPGDGRPSFTCTKCGRYWTSGKDGREYMGNRFAIKEES